MNSAEKVYKKAEENDLMGDEENAYVFYMRFFNIMQEVAKTAKYQNDKVTKQNTNKFFAISTHLQTVYPYWLTHM